VVKAKIHFERFRIRMKHGFTQVEVMLANMMLLILVAGFAKITE